MANETSDPKYKIVDQGAKVELNSENERIQTITPGPETDGFDTKFSNQIANVPESEDSENDRVELDSYRGQFTTTTTTAAPTTTTTTTV